MVRIVSHREVFKAALREKLAAGLTAAATALQTAAREAVNVPVVKVPVTRTRNTSRGRRGSEYRKVIVRSAPGEPPRKDSTHGQQNIKVWDADGKAGTVAKRVGVRANAAYMALHEVSNRSWLLTSLNTARPEMTQAFNFASRQ